MPLLDEARGKLAWFMVYFTWVHCLLTIHLEIRAARGTFTLRPGNHPVALLGAGVGVIPVLAMLHALAAETLPRETW